MTEESVNPEMEATARRAGWLPKEEFRGDPDNWIPAEQFVKIAEESLPHAKGTIKQMDKKMRQQEILIQKLQNDFAEFVEFSKSVEERAYNNAIKELQSKQRKAAEDGDLPAFDEATKELDEQISKHPATTKKEKKELEAMPGYDPRVAEWLKAEPTAFEDWKADNPWFTTEPDMFDYANRMDSFLHNKYGISKPQSERLEEITKLVKKKFPDYFGNPARKTGSPVEGDAGGSPSSGGRKTYADLPPEVKKQCDKFTGKDGKGESGTAPGLTRDEFVKQYFGKGE